MEDLNQDRIAAYLRNELSIVERQNLENEMNKNPALNQEFQIQKMILEHIELLEDRSIERQVRAVHQVEKKRRGSFFQLRQLRYWAAAASFLLLFAIGWGLWQSPSANPNELFAQNYSAYELRFGDRSDGDLLTEAGGAYLAERYGQAIPLFEELLAQNPNQSKAKFALGVCQMELEHWSAAVLYFEQLIETRDALYADNARWYLALSLLQLNQIEMVKSHLKILSETKGAYFQQKATELLDDLK